MRRAAHHPTLIALLSLSAACGEESAGGTNAAPTASSRSVTTAEDTTVVVVLSGDDPDGPSLTFAIASQPSHGVLTGSGPSVVYTPAADFFGEDGFTFTVSDGTSTSAPAAVSITVTPVNDAPQIADITGLSTSEDASLAIAVPVVDVDGDAPTLAVVTQPLHGGLSVSGDDLVYTPEADYHGPDVFTVRADDGAAQSGVATVSLTVLPVNDPPQASIGGGAVALVGAPLQLAGIASDIDGDALTYGWTLVSGPPAELLAADGPTARLLPRGVGVLTLALEVDDGAAPTTTTVELQVLDIAAGSEHSLFVRPDGTLWATGSNDSGQLGLGESGDENESLDTTVPVQVCASGECASAFAEVISADAGEYWSLALTADGSVWQWGYDFLVELIRPLPEQVCAVRDPDDHSCLATFSGAVQIDGGDDFAMALLGDGSVWTWGYGPSGQLGGGTTDDAATPVQVCVTYDADQASCLSPLGDVLSIAAGGEHALALRRDGSLWAWGNNQNNQLGHGFDSYSPVAVPVCVEFDVDAELCVTPLTGVIAIAAGDAHNLALTADGSLWAWGDEQGGALGIGCSGGDEESGPSVPCPVLAPVAIRVDDGSAGWSSITAGRAFSVAITSNGSLWAWGDNDDGELGDESLAGQLVPRRLPTSEVSWIGARAGDSHVLALAADGSLLGWGNGASGQIADGLAWRTTPVESVGTSGAGSDTDWALVSIDRSLVGAIKTDGTLWTWGVNQGDRGLGVASDAPWRARPQPVLGVGDSDTDWVEVDVAGSWGMARKSDGSVYAWGDNYYGRLGTGNTTPQSGLVPVCPSADTPCSTPLTNAVAIAATEGHGMALLDDGTVLAWGYNQNGQLGRGTASYYTPTIAPLCADYDSGTQSCLTVLDSVVSIAAARYRSYALKSDGSLWGWGSATNGSVGDGSGVSRLVPARVCVDYVGGVCNTYFDDIDSLAVGEHHALALRAGELWAWGANWNGQLGDGCTIDVDCVDAAVPKRIGTDTDWVAIAAGINHSVAVKADGTLWSWGSSYCAELGDGQRTARGTPAQVIGAHGSGHDSDWAAPHAGGFNSMALKQDGSLWGWGDNSYGQLAFGPDWPRGPRPVVGF